MAIGREQSADIMICRKITTGATAASTAKGTNFLGRPYGNFSQTVIQNSDLGGVIAPEGWEGMFDKVDIYAFLECMLTPICSFQRRPRHE